MIIRGKLINLRDTLPGDLADHERWLAPGQDWQNWDGPWEMERRLDEEALRRRLARIAEPPPDPRWILEIETAAGRHIGWVGSYWVCETNRWRDCGIVIAETDCQGRGYGREALTLWIDYLVEAFDLPRIGIGTWSGNERMIRLAASVGLVEEACFRDARLVRGQRHDAVRWGATRDTWRHGRARREGADTSD